MYNVPSPQEILSPFPFSSASISPASLSEFSSQTLAETIFKIPSLYFVQASGHEFIPHISFEISRADLLQSITPVFLEIIGAYVCSLSFCGVGVILPFSSPSIVFKSKSPPITAKRSNNSSAVSYSPISVSAFKSISPVSSPLSIFIVVTPVTFSPFIIAH